MARKPMCMVTIVIGQRYQDDFNRMSKARLEAYCKRHGYDLRIVTNVIRALPGKKLTWQKILLPELDWWRDYEQICVLDSDILIANDAPPLPIIPPGKIGCVPDKLADQINSGVLVYHPDETIAACMRETLKDTDPFWDQRALTRVMNETDMYFAIDPSFNRQFFFRCWTIFSSIFGRHWFYHACASKDKLRLIQCVLAVTRR